MSIVELSLDTIEAAIAGNSIVLIDFDSPRSATAAVFAPVYAASARSHPEVVHATVDVDGQERIAEIAAVHSFPTMLVFRDGVLVLREFGALSGVVLEELIRQVKLVDMDKVRAAVTAGQEADNSASDNGQWAGSARLRTRDDAGGVSSGRYGLGQ